MKKLSILVVLFLLVIGISSEASASEVSNGYWLSIKNLETSKTTYSVGEDIWLQPTLSYGHAAGIDMLHTVSTDEGVSVTIATTEPDDRIGSNISAIGVKFSTPGMHTITYTNTMIFYLDGRRNEWTSSFSIDREIIPIAEIKLLKP